MFCLNKCVASALIISTVILGGCASKQPDQQRAQLQRDAMERWNACLERNLRDDRATVVQVTKLMRNQCEGYRRDILSLFPPHQSGQVDQALVSSAYRFIDPRNDTAQIPAKNMELVQTLLR